MDTYYIATFTVALSSILAYFSYRFERLQPTVFVFMMSMLLAFFLRHYAHYFFAEAQLAPYKLAILSLDFRGVVLQALLSYLLFAGSLHLSVIHLRSRAVEVAVLAFATTTIAICLTALAIYYGGFGGQSAYFIAALLFAAAISPTDPVAVLALLKKINVSKELEVKIAGESLLNDGVGIVFFTTFMQLLNTSSVNLANMSWFFMQEVFGGAVLGLLLSYLAFTCMRSRSTGLNHMKEDVILTIALVNIGYLTAQYLHVSSALTAVSSGLSASMFLHAFPTSRSKQLLVFWDVVDELLNFVLFFLVGLEVFRMSLDDFANIYVLVLAVVVVLVVRIFAVALPLSIIQRYRQSTPRAISIISLAGVKGGLSLALASSIPSSVVGVNMILAMTYVVVAFTLIVQSSFLQIYLSRAKVAS